MRHRVCRFARMKGGSRIESGTCAIGARMHTSKEGIWRKPEKTESLLRTLATLLGARAVIPLIFGQLPMTMPRTGLGHESHWRFGQNSRKSGSNPRRFEGPEGAVIEIDTYTSAERKFCLALRIA
jgi:hypothetical protein